MRRAVKLTALHRPDHIKMLREAFYFLLGGVTFLPLCIVGIVLHFYFYAPSINQAAPPSIEADVELTHEKKLDALDLAARNAAIHAEIESAKGKDHPQGDTTAPPTAKRIGAPANPAAPKPFSSGWLTVRPTFESDKDAATTSSGTNSPATIPASLVEGESDGHSEDEGAAVDSTGAAIPSTKTGPLNVDTGYMSKMYRGILDYRIGKAGNKKGAHEANRSAAANTTSGSTPTGTAGKESFYCILKSPILYLYSSDDTANPTTECHAAIDLRGKRVSIFVAGLGDTLGELEPERPAKAQQATATDNEQLGDAAADQDEFDPKEAWKKAKRAVVRDGELFMKRNAIRVVGSSHGRTDQKSGRSSHLSRRRPQWFIFCKNNYIMEDWYHALLQASLIPDSSLSTKLPEQGPLDLLSSLFGKLDNPIGPTFSQGDMASLLVSLDSLPDPLPLRWLNALVGRIFFSIYRTAWLEDYIVSKMMKKLNRVKTPGFLGDIKVEEVDVGRRAPGFSRPMLKALTNEGEASMEIAVHYVGEIRITISTTLTLSLGSRFKPYNIPIVLAVVLRSLEGNLLLHVKKPPSNRLWFGFTTMPNMDIDIEPVVSERKVQWGMVTRLIESRLRELLTESIIVPNMDDIAFFDTRSLPLRGGIFADAAKKADMLKTELDGSSASATNSSATPATQQEQETKRGPGNIKASELLSANKIGTASAPVSGSATPVTHDRASTSMIRDGSADREGEASSIDAGAKPSTALRNRRSAGEGMTVRNEPSQQAARTTSPAAAGLSDLLSRDLAAGGGERLTNGSPPRQDAQGNKRRTWFGAGPKSSASSIASSSGLSTLSFGGRSGREQSSLALGNASIERPSQHPISTSGKSDAALAVPGQATTRRASDSVSGKPTDPLSEERKTSIASLPSPSALSIDGNQSEAHESEGDVLKPALVAAGMHREESADRTLSDPEQATGNPSLIVSSASEPVLALGTAELPRESSRETASTLGAPSHHEADEDRDMVDSPSSLTHSTRSSLRSSRSDVALPNVLTLHHNDDELTGTESSGDPNDLHFNAASRQTSRDTGGSQADSDSVASSQMSMPPPPPPRRTNAAPTGDRSAPRQDAAFALSNLQRSRYGLNPNDRNTAEGQNTTTGSTSAMLLTSWNKAKASMADKESRQAAARDAKDAIKKGWANWNAKRVEPKRTAQAEDEMGDRYGQEGITRSQSSRLSFTPGKSAWLASSPPDPTSFGLGFDKSSPEDSRSAYINYASRRSNHTDTDDDNASVHSNSSNRQPYRELRASKKVQGFDGASANGRASSVSSSKLASTASLATTASDTSAGDSSSWKAKWDAGIPSLTPPAPAYRDNRDEEGGKDPKRKGLEKTTSRDAPASITPPGLPRRKTSSSISSTGQTGGVVSFLPPAPSATTELASTLSPGLPTSAIATESIGADTDEQPSGADGKEPAQAGSVLPEPRTPERQNSAQPSSENVLGTSNQTLHDEMSSAKTVESPVAPKTSTEHDNLSTENTSTEAASPADKTATKAEPAWESTLSPDVSSPSLGSGIKKQPARATMMAIPGIPSMQKAGPQSFSAPPPPEPVTVPKGEADSSPSAFRASSLFKMPNFGSPSLKGVANSPGKSSADVGGSASAEGQAAGKVPPPVPARPDPGVEVKVATAAEPTALGLTQMETSSEGRSDAVPQNHTTVDSAAATSDKEDENASFAEIAKAEGPAADPAFEHAQLDTGDTVQIGQREIKLPSE